MRSSLDKKAPYLDLNQNVFVKLKFPHWHSFAFLNLHRLFVSGKQGGHHAHLPCAECHLLLKSEWATPGCWSVFVLLLL